MRPELPERPQRPAPRALPHPPEPPLDDDPDAPPFEIDVQQRLWLKAVIPLLQLRSSEADPSGRVQYAFDRMYISACERIVRILRGDLPDEPDAGP